MEIDITKLLDHDLMDYSASNYELGTQDAGRITWANALESGLVFVTTDEEKQEARDWLADFGAWSDEEIEGWNDTELNALILQFISGDLRRYLQAAQEGNESFRKYRENEGGSIYKYQRKLYFLLSN